MANFNFKESAKSAITVSPLMENRVKVSTDDIIRKYPDGVTVVAFDIVETTDDKTGEIATYPVVNIAEDNKVFFFGGAILNTICRGWVAGNDGDVRATSDALTACGGVKMKFSNGRTRKGNNITNVTIID